MDFALFAIGIFCIIWGLPFCFPCHAIALWSKISGSKTSQTNQEPYQHVKRDRTVGLFFMAIGVILILLSFVGTAMWNWNNICKFSAIHYPLLLTDIILFNLLLFRFDYCAFPKEYELLDLHCLAKTANNPKAQRYQSRKTDWYSQESFTRTLLFPRFLSTNYDYCKQGFCTYSCCIVLYLFSYSTLCNLSRHWNNME